MEGVPTWGHYNSKTTCIVCHRMIFITASINQSNFYSANIPGEARLSDATAESVINSKIEKAVLLHQQAMGSDGIYLQIFLKGSN